MSHLIKFIFCFFLTMLLFSCSDPDLSEKEAKTKIDSLQKSKTVAQDKLIGKEGVVGVFSIPELTTICKLDSAPIKDVAFMVAKNFSVIEEEANSIGADISGEPGMITYNNDTTNFVFECILPIKEIPKKMPVKSKIVVLEKSPMVIYNYYGSYKQLFTAYNELKKYIADNKLKQSGPMREFYLSDPTVEKDPAKWLTRIMVPVIAAK